MQPCSQKYPGIKKVTRGLIKVRKTDISRLAKIKPSIGIMIGLMIILSNLYSSKKENCKSRFKKSLPYYKKG
jgi:hypothetical protein